MSLYKALQTVQKYVNYGDYIPILNFYTFAPRGVLAITQIAHGTITNITLTNKQLLDGALNAGRCFVAYKLIYQRRPKPTKQSFLKPFIDITNVRITKLSQETIFGIEKRYFGGARLNSFRATFAAYQRAYLQQPPDPAQPMTSSWVQRILFGVSTAGIWIGFDLARGSATLEGLGKIGLLRIPSVVRGLEAALQVADYIPTVSFFSAAGRFGVGSVQLCWGSLCAAGAAAAYPFNALFGAVTPSALVSPVLWSGLSQAGRGLLNVGRGALVWAPVLGFVRGSLAWPPILGNIGLAAYDSFRYLVR